MKWPWSRREVRSSYTDAIVSALVRTAAGSNEPSPLGLGALESAVSMYQRAFASATIEPETTALTPSLLADAVRNVLRIGEWVGLIDVSSGAVRLLPVASWDVLGFSPDPNTWSYRVTLATPSGRDEIETVPADAVVHLRFAVDPRRPWAGIAPLTWAASTGRLGAALERSLGDEATSPVGTVIPVPATGTEEDDDTDTDPLASLRVDLAQLRGSVALIDSVAGGWGDKMERPDSDWRPRRIGPNPPDSEAMLRKAVEASICMVMGIPPSLSNATASAAIRESWRVFVNGSCEPLARQLAVELAYKLDAPGLRFDFSSLRSADVTGRARAVSSLVTAGMSLDDARAAVGL